MSKRPSPPAGWQQAVARFPAALRTEINTLWTGGGVVPPETVGRLRDTTGGDLGAAMMLLLPLAQHYAVVPVSHYQVGAVVAGRAPRGRSPALYLGANYEFERVALSFTVHAEQSATNNAWLHGEASLTQLAVTAAPCGYCRQFLNEVSGSAALSVLLPAKNRAGYRAAPLGEFLPRAFGPGDLGIAGGLMDPALAAPGLRLARGTGRDPVVAAALDAAQRSYAPYPTDRAGQFSGVALQLADGSVWSGRYAGNAAYNPSLSPFESAVAFARLNRPLGAPLRIARGVLVEVPTLASQRSATAAVLAALAPRVRLEYHAARLG